AQDLRHEPGARHAGSVRRVPAGRVGALCESGARGGHQGRVKLFYGWIIVAAGFITMAVGVNARTAFSLLFPPIVEEFGWERAATAGAFSFGFLVSAGL